LNDLFASDALIEIRSMAGKEEKDKKAAKEAKAQPYPSPTTSRPAIPSIQQTVFYGVNVLVEFAYSQSWIPKFGDWISHLFPLSQSRLFIWLI